MDISIRNTLNTHCLLPLPNYIFDSVDVCGCRLSLQNAVELVQVSKDLQPVLVVLILAGQLGLELQFLLVV